MAEVTNLNSEDKIIERHYEAGPPEGLELIEPGETFATTKEEEWVSKKTTEVTNTKQIETRVKRQVVLEDGKVVEDSGPVVTTNTTQDTETQEHRQTELRKIGEDDDSDKKQLENVETKRENAVAVANPDGIVREVKERRVISREEIEDVKETEDIHHYGDITDEAYLAAVNSGKSDLREVLKSKDVNQQLVSTGPRVVSEKHRSNKITDTEETRELSSVLPDGKIVTEIQRTTEHEEVKDDELPEGEPDQDQHRESHQRFVKVRNQEDVDYIADGVKVGHEMRFRAETTEAERRGDGIDEPDWDSLSARAKRRQQNGNAKPNGRVKGIETALIPTVSPLDRKDALTKRPLDFDQEEETRKLETSKWLEHHFGSESRSSRDSLDDIDEEKEEPPQPRTTFFNVTIKSQPAPQTEFVPTKVEAEQVPVRNSSENGYHQRPTRYFQGVSEWSERDNRKSPVIIRNGSSPTHYAVEERYQVTSPKDYKSSPQREVTPTPPQRKRAQERPNRLPVRAEENNWANSNGNRAPSRNEILDEPLEEPPPDYSPVSPPRAHTPNKKTYQKTRFAVDPPPAKPKSGNIIGQSIRKLVGKIRSASAERKAKQQQRAKRSPSPSYKQGHVIDNIHDSHNGNHMENGVSRRENSPGPVHRYYLGEDPFGGSIYGRENKYDGVKPARSTRRQYIQQPEEYRSQSTLGRFSKSTSRLGYTQSDNRSSQTLPRHLSKHDPPTRLERNNRSNSTINVSFINTVSTPSKHLNGAPAKPARTYRSNLSRSKSFNVDLESPYVGANKPQLTSPTGLKSPGLISSISRSQRDLRDDGYEYKSTSRFVKNGVSDNKRIFLNDLKQRAPELYKTLHEEERNESWKPPAYSTPVKNTHNQYNGDIYEPPTRLRDTHMVRNFKESFAPSLTPTTRAIIRRGSNSSNDYSETYHTTSRNDDPRHPTITNTVQSFSKKTIPSRDGSSFETIESTETKSVTKSRYRDGPGSNSAYHYNDRKLNGSAGPVVIEVRNNYK